MWMSFPRRIKLDWPRTSSPTYVGLLSDPTLRNSLDGKPKLMPARQSSSLTTSFARRSGDESGGLYDPAIHGGMRPAKPGRINFSANLF